MDAREKNKIKCKAYYERTKNNLSDEVKTKRKEQANVRQKRFYENNKELCRLRIYNRRIKKKLLKENMSKRIDEMDNLITENEIKIVKSLNLLLVIKKSPRLTMWNKNINNWTFKDYEKLLNLLQ